MPTIQQQSAAIIKKLHDTTNECLNSIKAMEIDISNWDPLIVYILCQKLDSETHHDYIESLKNPKELPTLSEFLRFLEMKFTSLESSRRKQDFSKPNVSQVNQNQHQKPWVDRQPINHLHNFMNRNFKSRPAVINHVNTKPMLIATQRKCILCKTCYHELFKCKQFLESSPLNRLKVIDTNKLCRNCLINHYDKECSSEKTCRFCNQHHNTLLHNALVTLAPSTSSNTNFEVPNKKSNICVTNVQKETMPKLLATAKINIQSVNGCHHTMRALIDPCAESSLITENAAQLLGLPRIKRHCVVVGVGSKANNSRGVVQIAVSSIHNNFTFQTEAYVMKNVVGNLPNESFEKPTWSCLKGLSLADPEFYKSKPIDLIFSVDVYELIILPGLIRKGTSLPIAQNTKLGWILSGTVKPNQTYCNVVKIDLQGIQRFWEIEDISDNSINISEEDNHCLQHYQQNTTRQLDGRYVVRLPLKPEIFDKLGDSKTKAVAQFRQLEKRFSKTKVIEQSYKQFIQEYINLNHMKKCHSNPILQCYLPHHCVIRTESVTTGTRVVFNASAKTSTGYSLNDLMYSGPNLQEDLFTLILKWRQYKIAFTADIEKMFRFIDVHEDDQPLQKIVWRDTEQQPLQEYQLTTVTYGTKAAPFLAMITLKRLAKDEGHRYPEAADALANRFYMDDLLHGQEDLESAKKLIADLIKLLKLGGFNLRKWASNKPEVLPDDQLCKDQAYVFKYQESTKTLGLEWHPNQDYFTFQLKSEPVRKLTKRSLISNISKIFDPLGWLTPITTKLKLLFQEVWLLNQHWDDDLPVDIYKRWKIMEADITKINHITIPRWLQSSRNKTIELHGFCDSSQNAYACVVYCKVNHFSNKKSSVVLVAAKSRLVPVKKIVSLPRLELCATVLLSKVVKITCNCLSDYNIKMYGWSDSTAVLGWLNGDPNKWKPFVASRVKQVTDVISPSSWHYVSTEDNPADCASRGITAEQLKNHSLWWTGPQWLQSFEESKLTKSSYTTSEELKKQFLKINVTTVFYENKVMENIISRYSDFTRASRVLAWVLRFTTKLYDKPHYLTTLEIRKAKYLIIKYVQEIEFLQDIEYIKKHKKANPKSNILKLNPFIDGQGLLRVGGRLANAQIEDRMKHPCILPQNHQLTEKIIDQAHKMTFHGGARLTLAWLRQEYWILGGINAVKKRLQKCVLCKRHNPLKHDQLMGDLPPARINKTRPFYHTGVDFTGFVDVKSAKGRGVRCTKGYIAVFVCMVTKAVHLELVSDLTSSAFLAALRRLAARRGSPGHIFSDNGTNFIKANRVLQEEVINLKSILNDQFYAEIADMSIEWHFNAPSWPSAGGLWEAAVKSLKYHLKRVIGEQKLTYEEFSTLLAQLEACLNSRPLCPLSEDVEDLDFLTPSHFLSSGPTLTIVETEHDLRTRWQLVQKIYQDVWKRWKMEYLIQLNARSKWQRSQPNLNIGNIVIIHDANLPPGKWALGRIVQLHPGQDGLVRVVSVKTKNGLLKRPIVKLSLLPINHSNDTDISQSSQNINIPNNQSNNTLPKRRARKGIYHLFTMAIMLFTFLFSPATCAYKAMNFNDSQSLYFDKISTMRLIQDEWKLVVYYDLEPYWQGSKLLSKYIDHIDYLCKETPVRSHCESILIQLRHGYTEFMHYNNILSTQQFPRGHARRKRGLVNIVGNVAHSLFGVLDDQFAEQYIKDINLIRENENHLADLWKNQTSVVEAEYNVLKRMQGSIDKQHKIFTHYINQLKNTTNNIENHLRDVETISEFLLCSIAANSLESNLKNTQDVLLDTVLEVYFGRFNIHLLKPDQLLQELNIISGKLSKDLMLPIENPYFELTKIYNLLKVRAKMLKGYLIFEIKIPLVSRDNYQIYKIYSVPIKNGKTMVTLVPASDYIAINLRRDSFMPISQLELYKCIRLDSETYLCSLQKPISHMGHDDIMCSKDQETKICRTSTEKCQDRWSQLSEVNSYFFFCCDSHPVRIICGEQMFSDHLNNSGIVKLGPDCVLKGKDITIYAQRLQNNTFTVKPNIPTIDILPINHIFNRNETSVSLISEPSLLSGDDQELNNISIMIKQMRSGSGLKSGISYHDVHHYVAIYVVACVLVGGAAAYAVRRWCPRRRRRQSSSAAAPAGAAQRAQPASTACDPPRPEPRGQQNTAFVYSVSDQCVSVINHGQSSVQNSDKCGDRVKDQPTSPLVHKHKFGDFVVETLECH